MKRLALVGVLLGGIVFLSWGVFSLFQNDYNWWSVNPFPIGFGSLLVFISIYSLVKGIDKEDD